jgi:hypothetical protein
LFKVSRYLHRYYSPEEICKILEARVANCGRTIDPHEITDAVSNSGTCKWTPSAKSASERRAEWLASPTRRSVPEFNPERTLRAAARIPIDITPGWLKAHSPASVNCSTAQFLRSVFEPQEKVIVFDLYKSQGRLWPDECDIERFSRRHHLAGAWFLCNPVDGQFHWNPRILKDSRRSEESIVSFRYAVLECDREPKDEWFPIWLKILVQLRLAIVAITDSAGRSAHALVRVSCESKQAWDQFKFEKLRPLVPFGADDGALSAVRLTRLPQCYRTDRKQELLYLNPSADGTPIFRKGN